MTLILASGDDCLFVTLMRSKGFLNVCLKKIERKIFSVNVTCLFFLRILTARSLSFIYNYSQVNVINIQKQAVNLCHKYTPALNFWGICKADQQTNDNNNNIKRFFPLGPKQPRNADPYLKSLCNLGPQFDSFIRTLLLTQEKKCQGLLPPAGYPRFV